MRSLKQGEVHMTTWMQTKTSQMHHSTFLLPLVMMVVLWAVPGGMALA
jgi:hypothetical protein